MMSSLVFLLASICTLAIVSKPAVAVANLAAPLLLIGAGGCRTRRWPGITGYPGEKAGMGAGLLNTFRLGIEAIAVSLYGSALATLLYGKLQPPLPLIEQSASIVKYWINEVAAGNLNITIPTNNEFSPAQIGPLLRSGYDGAPHTEAGGRRVSREVRGDFDDQKTWLHNELSLRQEVELLSLIWCGF